MPGQSAQPAGKGLSAVRAAKRHDSREHSTSPVPPVEPKPAKSNPREQRLRKSKDGVPASRPGLTIGRKPVAGKARKRNIVDATIASKDAGISDAPLGVSADVEEGQERERIKDASMRGVSLGQLLDFYEEDCGDFALEAHTEVPWQRPVLSASKLARKCIHRNQSRRIDISEGRAHKLVPDMFAVDELCIAPRCEPTRVSMAELLNPDGRLIRVFVSHSWSEPFCEFVQGLYCYALSSVVEGNAGMTSPEIHVRARETSFYIWAFCTNRWKVKAEATKRLEDGLFYKVLAADTTWNVILCLDREADVFQRAWCALEVYFSMDLQFNVVLNTCEGPLQNLEAGKSTGRLLAPLMEHLQDLDVNLALASRRSDLDLIQAKFDALPGSGENGSLSGSSAVSSEFKSMVASAALPLLASLGDLRAAKQALESSADPNASDARYIRPLTYAVVSQGVNGDLSCLLLQKGADPLGIEHADAVQNLFASDDDVRSAALANVPQVLSADAQRFHANALIAAEYADAERRVQRQALALVSSDLEARSNALQNISTLGDAAAPAIANCLGDAAVSMRDKAEAALENMHSIGSAAENLARLLRHESADVRRRAVGWLGECGEDASYFMQSIVEAVSETDCDVSSAASSSLQNMGELVMDMIPELLHLLESKVAHVRLGAAEVLLGLEVDQSLTTSLNIAVLLMDPERKVRELAASLFSSRPSKHGQQMAVVVASLSSPECDVRHAGRRAFESLGKHGCEATSEVFALLSHEELDVRTTAAEVLNCIEWWDSPQAPKAVKSVDVQTLLASDDDGIRNVLSTGIEILGTGAAKLAPKVVQLLASEDAKVCERASELLEAHASLATGAAPALSKLFSHERDEVRKAAVVHVAQLGAAASSAVAALAGLLADPVVTVRVEAAKAFEALDEHAVAAVPSLAKLLRHDDDEVRVSAAKVLRGLGDDTGDPCAQYAKQIAQILGEEVPRHDDPDSDDVQAEQEEQEEQEEDEEEHEASDEEDEAESAGIDDADSEDVGEDNTDGEVVEDDDGDDDKSSVGAEPDERQNGDVSDEPIAACGGARNDDSGVVAQGADVGLEVVEPKTSKHAQKRKGKKRKASQKK